jgi:Tfp pilus assembly protein FimT
MPRYREERQQQTEESPSYLRDKKDLGFTFFELTIVLSLMLIVAVISIPSLRRTLEAYRGSSASRGIAGQLALARMRAASDATRTKLSIDTTNNTYIRQVYNKTSLLWETEGDGPQYLDKNVSFGFGSITTAAGGQSSIAQTTDIYFNSRGIPIRPSDGMPIGDNVIYLDNNAGTYYAVSVNITGQIRNLKYSAGATPPWVDE